MPASVSNYIADQFVNHVVVARFAWALQNNNGEFVFELEGGLETFLLWSRRALAENYMARRHADSNVVAISVNELIIELLPGFGGNNTMLGLDWRIIDHGVFNGYALSP